MATYTIESLERLLRSYLDIRYALAASPQRIHDTYAVRHKKDPNDLRERPLGMRGSDTRGWPFHDTPHAQPPRDGKAKARSMEELHVSVIDIEEALKKVSDDDLEIIYKYYIFQTHTLDELTRERGVTSRGSMQRRAQRAVSRLVRELEEGPYHGE